MLKYLLKRIIPKPLINILLGRKSPRESYIQISNILPKISCIDVGASYYPHPQWSIFLNSPSVRWFAVDPNAVSLRYINEWKHSAEVHPVQVGLSRTGGRLKLYATNVDTGSSLLEPKLQESFAHRISSKEYFFPYSEHNIDTITLQKLVDGSEVLGPIFIKLDTQGTELSILQGGAKLFDEHRIVGVELESTMMAEPIMDGSGKFWQAAKFLEENNFELLTLKPIHFSSKRKKLTRGRLVVCECDMIFSIRRDIAYQLGIESQIALLAFYITNQFYEEAILFIEDSSEVTAWLNSRNIDVSNIILKLESDIC